jgi:putative ABC transport system permease protein
MNDLKFAIRQLLKNPGFTAVAVLTLALGIGASSTVFSLVQGVLLTPPPYPQPDRLVLITPTRADGQRYTRGWPAAQWQEWKTESKSFEAIAGYGWTFNFLVLTDGSQSIEGLMVTPDYFKVMGTQPMLGRPFEESDAPASGPRTSVILGHDLWQRRFNGNPDVIGQSVQISRRAQPMTVVGVMPPGIRFLPSPNVTSEPNYNEDAKVDYWMPARLEPERLKRPDWNIVGRMRPGVTLAQAQVEIASMTARQAGDEPEFAGITPRLQLLETHLHREGRRLLLPMAGAVALVFLIACGNAAGLLLARGLQRQHEYAVRSALGARPLQLCRPVLL